MKKGKGSKMNKLLLSVYTFTSFLLVSNGHTQEVKIVSPQAANKLMTKTEIINSSNKKMILHTQEPHRPGAHLPEAPRTNPPLELPNNYMAKGRIKSLNNKTYSYKYEGDSLYSLFKNCQADLNKSKEISTKDIYVQVKTDRLHQEQHLCPDKSSEEKIWKGAFSICEQITKEVAVTHGVQSNCSRYPHTTKWWKTLKSVQKEDYSCPTGFKGKIVKTYEQVQLHQCLFSVSEALNTVKKGDLIAKENHCKQIPKDCHINGNVVAHGHHWSEGCDTLVKTLSCPKGHTGHKSQTLQVKQKYSCNNGKVLSVGQPYTTDIVLHSSNTCIAEMKRCGAYAHNDEWEVRVGRKVVKKSCVGGNQVEISYPKLRTMVCKNGTSAWKDSVVNVGKYKVFPSQSCSDSPYSTTRGH